MDQYLAPQGVNILDPCVCTNLTDGDVGIYLLHHIGFDLLYTHTNTQTHTHTELITPTPHSHSTVYS